MSGEAQTEIDDLVHGAEIAKPESKRIMVLGATGTIGQATVRALVRRGHCVVCFVRAKAGERDAPVDDARFGPLRGAILRFGDVTDPVSFARDGLCAETFDVLLSCLASRTGEPKDAWAIDHDAHVNALAAGQRAGISQMVLLSALCVQKPLLAFQQAKLAFERVLILSGVTYSIVRPTAYFKSLSGQIDRLKRGKPFLVFGDGKMTACKPISDGDLGEYLAQCIDDESRHNRVLPIGGPGDAITPKQQGEQLFKLLGREPNFRHVPIALLDAIVWTLGVLGRVVPRMAAKAELARIGRYYATESMLVLDPVTGRYDAGATPSAGSEDLFAYYASVIKGEVSVSLGDHAVF